LDAHSLTSIRTLIPDVQELLEKKGEKISDAFAREFSHNLSKRLSVRLNEEKRVPRLRLSYMGPRCPKALWHSIHTPELAERLPPWAEFKFMFGDIMEELAISLAKEAGHTVEGEQDAVSVDGIEGHRDCVIDGCIVDVKSASSRSYLKFKDKSIAISDTFGYLAQLDGYLVGSHDDPIVVDKDHGYLWAIDKQLGHMCLYEHTKREDFIRKRIRDYKAIVSLNEPPQCTCETVSDGESGNIALGVNASYSQFKFSCFPQLRCFLYSKGPRYLTHVAKQPRNKDGPIPEVDRNGNYVYH
jgi:hypothetical protein